MAHQYHLFRSDRVLESEQECHDSYIDDISVNIWNLKGAGNA